jgi:hypothetical protein
MEKNKNNAQKFKMAAEFKMTSSVFIFHPILKKKKKLFVNFASFFIYFFLKIQNGGIWSSDAIIK